MTYTMVRGSFRHYQIPILQSISALESILLSTKFGGLRLSYKKKRKMANVRFEDILTTNEN
jgi:hypothetical protein